MKRTITLMILCIAVAVAASAQQKPADQAAKTPAALPTVDQILDKYVQALGGKTAIEKVTSTLSTGTFEIPAFGASGPVESATKAPNKSVLKLDVPGFGVVQEGFNGTVAWSQEPTSGLREKSGAELAAAKLDEDFYRPIRLKELYPKIIVKGQEKIGEKDAFALQGTPAGGATETWYFDADSGLLMRMDIERETPQGKMAIQIFYEDYKDLNGVKVAHTLRQVNPAFTITIKFNDEAQRPCRRRQVR